jgi:hypothetical protein
VALRDDSSHQKLDKKASSSGRYESTSSAQLEDDNSSSSGGGSFLKPLNPIILSSPIYDDESEGAAQNAALASARNSFKVLGKGTPQHPKQQRSSSSSSLFTSDVAKLKKKRSRDDENADKENAYPAAGKSKMLKNTADTSKKMPLSGFFNSNK